MKTLMLLAMITAMALSGVAVRAQDPGTMQQNPKLHRELMPVHAKWMEEQKLQDAEMVKLLAAMNSATGEKRIDAVIAVVNKMVEQRKVMQEKMGALLDR